MTQIALSIVKMQKLESLGLDTSDASMLWLDNGQEPTLDLNIEAYHEHPYDIFVRSYAYTLQDILEKVRGVTMNDQNLIALCMNKTRAFCTPNAFDDEQKQIRNFGMRGDILDSAYQMLLFCLENDLIKTHEA